MSEKNSERARRAPSRTMLRRTLFLLSVCGIAAFAVLILRLGKLQIVDHERYEQAAVEQQLRGAPISAARGTIYDRDLPQPRGNRTGGGGPGGDRRRARRNTRR